MQAYVTGSRLSFVVVPLDMDLVRPVVHFDQRKAGRNKDGTQRYTNHMTVKPKAKPGGYMVYFPQGHAIRIPTLDKLKHYGLDRQPKIINMQGLNDPNSPLGRLVMAQDKDQDGRMKAWQQMEQDVIHMATRKSGKRIFPEQLEDARELQQGDAA